MFILAGDVGGTHTRLLCAEVTADKQHVVAEHSYSSADFSDLAEVIACFLSEYPTSSPVMAACIAVAGPVISGVASVTNLPWVIDEKALSNTFNIAQVKLINDFIAVVHGIEKLDDSELLTVHRGVAVDKKSAHPDAAVIGAGTGFGVAQRRWIKGQYHAIPSEAGHTGFAPETAQQTRLLSWLQKTHTHVSLEMLLSGNGLLTIYDFLHEAGQISSSSIVAEEMKKSDPAQVITAYALADKDELCRNTLQCFVEIYGAAAGNAALQFYPVEEVYIAGGIAPRIKNKLLEQDFINAFINKGPMSANMDKITIRLITQEKVGLYGALSKATTLWQF